MHLRIDYNVTHRDLGLHEGPQSIKLASLQESIAGITIRKFDANKTLQEERAAAAVIHIRETTTDSIEGLKSFLDKVYLHSILRYR
jgi:hypothetical protein